MRLRAQNPSGDGSGESPHWSQNFKDQYGNDAQTRQVALADVTGPGTEYLRDLNAVATGEITYGDKAELLDVRYAETTRQAGVLTKAAIAIASGGNAWLSFGLNTVADAAISGEIDLENIVKDAAFTYVSGGFGSGPSAPIGSGQWAQDLAVQSVRDGTIQTVIYGGSLKDNVLNSASQFAVNSATGVLQNQVGDIKEAQLWGEGSVPGALLHGSVGGLASVAKNGDFAAGFVSAAGTEFATGFVHSQTGGDKGQTANTIGRYVNPALAALTSGGDLGQFSINQGINASQLQNNYLKHTERFNFLSRLSQCNGDKTCIDDITIEFTEISDKNNAELLKAIEDGDLDKIEEIRARIPTDMLEFQTTVFAYLKDDPVAASKFADVLNAGAFINVNGNLVTASDATFYALRDGYYDNSDVESIAALGVSEFGPMGLTPNLAGLLGARGRVGAGKYQLFRKSRLAIALGSCFLRKLRRKHQK